MKVKIHNRFDSQQTEILIENDGKLYNFETFRWDNIDYNVAVEPDYILRLPTEIFNVIAQEIKTLDNIPDKTKSFQEGKIESMMEHLSDLRKLVFKKKAKK